MPDSTKTKRLTIDISPEEHRRLKIAAANAGLSMRVMLLQVIRREVLATSEAA